MKDILIKFKMINLRLCFKHAVTSQIDEKKNNPKHPSTCAQVLFVVRKYAAHAVAVSA